MQYCSLQHRILLLSPVTSTTGYCFCFGSIPKFFLELYLHWSPVAYWTPNDLGVPLLVSYHFAFSYCSCGSQGKNTTAAFIPFSSGPHSVMFLLKYVKQQIHEIRNMQSNLSFTTQISLSPLSLTRTWIRFEMCICVYVFERDKERECLFCYLMFGYFHLVLYLGYLIILVHIDLLNHFLNLYIIPKYR